MYLQSENHWEWPAKPLLIFLRQLTDGDALLRIQGGTSALVTKLIENIEVVSGSAITKVQEQGEKVLVENTQAQQMIV